jgi:hypothetical protein
MSSKISQKIAAVGLSLTTAVWLGGALMIAPANAATSADLQAQIQALLAQVQQLQSQLATSGGTTTGAASVSCTFTRNLTVGSTGADVKCLQEYLNASGYTVAASGAGSVGHETTYFGPATKAALAKWQAANGVTPSAGYFGPLSRAEYVKLSTTTGTTTGTGTTVPTGTGLTVSLGSTNPASGNVAINAMNTPLMVLNFTAGSQAETVNNLTLTRQGFSQDTDLQNVYLYQGANRLAQNTGINSGAITFSNVSGGLFTVPAGQTVSITVSADITNSTASASHVLQLALASATNVGLASTDTVNGTFPITGNSFTLVNLTNLATLTVTNLTTGNTTVNAGQTSYLAGQFSVQASNNPVKVTSIRLTNIGSIQTGYLQNIKLMNGSTQLGSTVSLNNNVATFDLSSNPLLLASGQTVTLSVYADVTGGVGRTFQLSAQQASDIQAVDSMYNVGIGATAASGQSFPYNFYNVSVNQGGLVMSRDTNSPSTNVVAGNTNQVLAKFDILASGDSIKFTAMSFGVSGLTAGTINNFRVTDQTGAQIGTTQTSVTTSTDVNYSSLNYIVPANTTNVLTVYGDIPSTATGNVQVTLNSTNTTAQSYTTFVSATPTQVQGYSLTILASTSNLTASANYAFSAPAVVASTQQAQIASFNLTAGQVNNINLNGITLNIGANSTVAGWLQNVTVKVNGTQFGQPQPTVASGSSYTFTATPIVISANQTAEVDVYANVSNAATATSSAAITLSSVNASTAVSGNSVSITSTTGQTITFSTGGTITAAVDASTAQAQYVGMGVTSIPLAAFRFSTGSTGGSTLTQAVFADAVSSATSTTSTNRADFINYRLMDGTTQLATAVEASNSTLTFNFTEPIAVNDYAPLTVVADANNYPYATSGDTHAIQLTGFTYNNPAGSTPVTVAYSSTSTGNTFTVYRTALSVVPSLPTSYPASISGGSGSTVAQFTFTAGSSYDAVIESVTMTAVSNLIQTGTSTLTLGVYGSNNPSVVLATTTATSSGATMTFTLNGSTGWDIAPGQTYTLAVKLYGATPLTNPATVGTNAGNFAVNLTGVTWTDGTTGGSSISLNPNNSPALPFAGGSITGLNN